MDSFSSGTRQFINKMIAQNNEKGWLDLSKGPHELYAVLQRIGEDKAQIEEEGV